MLRAIIEKNNNEDLLLKILNEIHLNGPVSDASFEALAYLKKFDPAVFNQYEKKLLYLIGLFYKTSQPQSVLEEIYSLFGAAIEEDTGRKFTPVQADVYKSILKKKYFSFSAPTSSGKSYLFRELIKDEEGDIVIVVPSRALIAEYISVILTIIKNSNSILVLPFIDHINIKNTKRRIFVITPERGTELFKYDQEFNIRLFLLDEAQISDEDKVRGMKFDSFVRRIDKIFPNAKKVFAHPFVKNPDAQITKHGFNQKESKSERYGEHSVGKICLRVKNKLEDSFEYFSPYVSRSKMEFIPTGEDTVKNILINNGAVLVYTSKKNIYSGEYKSDFKKYIEFCPKITNPKGLESIRALKEFIGDSEHGEDKGRRSSMIEMMERGVVIHHGSMPLRARFIIEDFVRAGHARICFSTSTLIQGINMPFDIVWIDKFLKLKPLALKNLVGRAGRTTPDKPEFEYGYIVVNEENVPTFSARIDKEFELKNTSSLDEDLSSIPNENDLKDTIEAIQNDSFDDDLHLTKSQVERLDDPYIEINIQFILDHLLEDGHVLTGENYHALPQRTRTNIRTAFEEIYAQHLRRPALKQPEKDVLETAIPIMLWRIQGKSFREIVSLRYYFLSRQKEQKEINNQFHRGEITKIAHDNAIQSLTVRYSQIAESLPNAYLRAYPRFPNKFVFEIDYDTLVYDTYDYLDKVISLSLVDPIAAALDIYYQKFKDERALIMKNYVRFGTNDAVEIWLCRYGFGFEEIDWLKKHIEKINQRGIVFKRSIDELSPEQRSLIERYV